MVRRSVLLIEDNPDDVLLTQRAFRKNNIENPLIVVRDGVEALEYLFGTGSYDGRDLNEMPALILLDLKLPRLDGHEVLTKIRADARTKRLLVVVLTSSKEEADLLRSYDTGANGYIRKPVDFNEFQECVGQLGLYWLMLNELPPQ